MADYTLSVNIKGDSEEFKRALKAAQDAVDGFERQTTSMSPKMINTGNKIAGMGAKMTIGLTVPLALGAKSAITAASDYEENLNKIDVAFGESGKAVKEWSETAIKQFGLSKNQALEAAALFGDMATSMGLTKPAASDMSISLASLAGDLASFKNIGVDQAMTALAGVFTGETESLKQLGIVMTETNLEEFASKTGKVYKSMSQAEKVQLRYNYVMEMSQNAIGDYARTSDGTANSMRTFKGSVENLGITMGKELLPIITPLIQKATKLVEEFGDLSPETKQLIVKVGLLAAAMGPLTTVAGKTISTTGKLISGVKSLTGVMGGAASSSDLAGKKISWFAKIAGSTPGQIGLGIAAVGGLVAVFKNAWDEAHKATKAAEEFAETCKERVSDVQAQGAELDVLYHKFENLSGIENKNQAQKEALKDIVDQLNGSVEGLNLQYDAEKDMLNMTTDAIKDKIDAQKKSMLVDAYMENSKEAMSEYADKVAKVADLEAQRAEKQEYLNNLIASNTELSDVNRSKIKETEKELQNINAQIDDNTTAMFKNMQEATKYQNLATMETEAWKELGLDIPKNIAKGIKDGSYVVPQSAEDLQELIKFDGAVNNAKMSGSAIVKQLQIQMSNGMPVSEATERLKQIISFQESAEKAGIEGQAIVQSLSSSMASGEISIQEGTNRMNAIISFQEAASRAGLEGNELVTALSTSIGNGDISVETAVEKLTEATGKELSLMPPKASQEGSATSSSYASGISSGVNSVINTAKSVANQAKAGLRADARPEGENFTYGVGEGMQGRGPLSYISSAANTVVNAALSALQFFSDQHSPAKLFADESGVFMTRGVAVGMINGIKYVKAAGKKVVGAAIRSVQGSNQDIHLGVDGYSYAASRTMPQNLSPRYTMSAARTDSIMSGINSEPRKMEQVINIYQPVNSPAETARAIRKQATFGLAGV